MEIKLRLAKIEDAQEILDIYIPYVIDSNITFEYTAPSLDDFENRMKIVMRTEFIKQKIFYLLYRLCLVL